MPLKTNRQGRITIKSGDSTPLEKIAGFSNGDFSFTEAYATSEERDRGTLMEVTAGPETPVEWSFSFRYVDKTLLRCLRDKVWDSQAESFGGLTPSSNNLLTPAYAFEQNSVVGGTGETIVKIANGATPTADNELAEAVGVLDVEDVVKVAIASGAIQVYQPAADTDRDLVYDAVGQGTTTQAGCEPSRKTFNLVLDLYETCNPPSPKFPLQGVVEETYTLTDAYLLGLSFTEGEEADTVSVNGRALIQKVPIT